MPELDAMNPEMDPQQPAGTPDGGTDREGAMAKADLYKLANYSHKLFQQMHDDDQLEAWVQAKITKAADYIASVYHYLEYEMKFSEYGHHLDNSDTLSEGQRMRLKEMLAEAKSKVKDLKKSQAEKIKEDRKEDTKTQHGTATSTYDDDGKRKSVVHKDERKYSDEPHGGVASIAKSKSAGEKKKEAPEQKFSPKSAKTYGMKNSEKFDNRDKVVDENMEPCDHCGGAGHVPKSPVKVHPQHAGKVAKYARLKDAVTAIMNDKNNNGIDDKDEIEESADEKCNHTAKGKKCPVHGLKECSGMYEAQKTMSRAAKGHEKYGKEGMAALAKAGREGKSLDKIRDKYDKYDESVEANGKKPCPPMSHVKKMCQDGKSVSEICKMHPDCDHAELKQMVADCKSKMDEASMPMKKVNGKSVPAFAADGKGKNDLSKKKAVKEDGNKIAAQAMWEKIKETSAYVAEKKAIEKKDQPMKGDKVADESNKFVGTLKKAREEGDTEMTVDGKTIPVKPGKPIPESTDMARLRELTKHLLG